MNTTLTLSLFFIISVFVSYMTNLFFLKYAHTFGSNKGGAQLRWASAPKPPVGGMSFYAVFVVIITVLFFKGASFSGQSLFSLLLPVTVGFGVGLADDSYNTPPSVKFIGQFTTAILLLSFGNVIHISDSTVFNYCFTTIWVVGMMNSINMLDNMDGIVSSVSIVALLACLVLMGYSSQNGSAEFLMMLTTIGGLVGFLFVNWSPAKVYMGDTGSQFLGAFLAWISIRYCWNIRDMQAGGIQISQFLVPTLVFAVSLMDTVTVTVRRIMQKRSPFVGGRDHTTHHLAYLGLSDPSVVILLTCFAIVSAFMACCMVVFSNWSANTILFVMAYLLFTFTMLQRYYDMAKAKKEEMKSKPMPQKQESLANVEEHIAEEAMMS
jgi:UDP-GlcNAc:undecaprenyl-phosphate/decaprenyl-phosphate GlcNAc-1-phosphate transferase